MHKHLTERRPEHVGPLTEMKLCKTHLWPATFEGFSSNLELVEWGFKKTKKSGDKLSVLCGYVVPMVEDFYWHLEWHCLT